MMRIRRHTSLIRAGLGLALASVFTVAPSAADAVTVDINSVSGVWTSAAPLGAVSGIGTNQIQWGIPADGEQSGYKFVGAAPPTVTGIPGDTAFNLGTFSHFNFAIYPPYITSAVLNVTTNLTVHDGFTQTLNIDSIFTFHHNETPNVPGSCPPGSISICDDGVTFAINLAQSQSFVVDNTLYFVTVNGFLVGGNLASAFLTQEGQTNVATLQGIVTSAPGVFTTVEIVPAPLSLLLLGAGFVGLMLSRRRR